MGERKSQRKIVALISPLCPGETAALITIKVVKSEVPYPDDLGSYLMPTTSSSWARGYTFLSLKPFLSL